MIDVTTKVHFRLMPKKAKNPFSGSKLTTWKYDFVDVHYHEGTDVPFFHTTSLLDSFKERVEKLQFLSFKDNETEAAKEYFRREFDYLKTTLEELTKALDNLSVKQEDFKP